MRIHQLSVIAAALLAVSAFAKLPPPSDEAKAKAAEAATKAAWSGKVEGYLLCKAQDRAVANHQAAMKQAGKPAKPAAAASPCADPGPFVAPGAAAPVAPAAKKS